MTAAIKLLEQKITRWAESRDDIRAVLVIGSQARRVHPADELSDLDLLVFTTNLESYTTDGAWLEQFGEIWVSLLEDTGGGDPEWLVIYAGGHKVDLVFYATDRLTDPRTEPGRGSNWRKICRRGVYALVDKDNDARPILDDTSDLTLIEPPTAEQFDLTSRRFWYSVMIVAKFIRRGELWVVQSKQQNAARWLLQVLEWQAAMQGRDPWHEGRFMQEWVDPAAYNQLPGIFSQWAAIDSWRGLLATMSLFREVAGKVAQHYQLLYPTDLDQHASQYVENLRL